MLEPRPEIRMATRRLVISIRQIEVAAVNHALIAGCFDDFAEIEAWANERIDWLRGFLALENGISKRLLRPHGLVRCKKVYRSQPPAHGHA